MSCKLTLSNIIWPLGVAQFILGVLVVVGESANFVLKVMKIQCFFSMGLDPKRAFGPYYELVKMDHAKPSGFLHFLYLFLHCVQFF